MRDADIRCVLRAKIQGQHQGDPDTRVIDELGLRQGSVRVDIAVVNGVTHGYEIKSLADTLRRLPAQASVYSQVLDYVTIVLAERHRAEVLEIVPKWWGIEVAVQDTGGETELAVWRKPARNPSVDKRALAELLWRNEALEMLRARNAIHGVTTKPRAFAWDRLCETYSLEEIAGAVRERLKEREGR
jgi:hypothetical protein